MEYTTDQRTFFKQYCNRLAHQKDLQVVCTAMQQLGGNTQQKALKSKVIT